MQTNQQEDTGDHILSILAQTFDSPRAAQLYSELQERNAAFSPFSLATSYNAFLEIAETTAELEELVGLPGTRFYKHKQLIFKLRFGNFKETINSALTILLTQQRYCGSSESI